MDRNYLAIILAAGKGTRLEYKGPKALFEVNKIPLIQYLFKSITNLGSIDLLTVVGHKRNTLINYIKNKSMYTIQEQQLGTAHAVNQCTEYIKKYKNTFIFVGDAPFISESYISSMIKLHEKEKSDCTFLYSKFPINLPYGRLIFNNQNRLLRLVEFHHANKEEIKSNSYFTSQYLFKSSTLLELLKKINPDIKTGEFNLTDSLNILIGQDSRISPLFIKNYKKLIGINSIEDFNYIINK
tara:strand:+ start:34 stop:753 length:720 start_codon:yes stop_codon:yes gene_type:complete